MTENYPQPLDPQYDRQKIATVRLQSVKFAVEGEAEFTLPKLTSLNFDELQTSVKQHVKHEHVQLSYKNKDGFKTYIEDNTGVDVFLQAEIASIEVRKIDPPQEQDVNDQVVPEVQAVSTEHRPILIQLNSSDEKLLQLKEEIDKDWREQLADLVGENVEHRKKKKALVIQLISKKFELKRMQEILQEAKDNLKDLKKEKLEMVLKVQKMLEQLGGSVPGKKIPSVEDIVSGKVDSAVIDELVDSAAKYLEELLAELQKTFEGLEKQIKDQQDGHEARMKKKNEDEQKLMEELQELEGKISDEQGKAATLTQEIQNLTSSTDVQEIDLSNALKAAKKKRDDEIQDHGKTRQLCIGKQTEIDRKQGEIKGKKEAIEKAKEDMVQATEAHKKQLEEKDKKIGDLEKDIEKFEKSIKVLNREIKDLNERITQLQSLLGENSTLNQKLMMQKYLIEAWTHLNVGRTEYAKYIADMITMYGEGCINLGRNKHFWEQAFQDVKQAIATVKEEWKLNPELRRLRN